MEYYLYLGNKFSTFKILLTATDYPSQSVMKKIIAGVILPLLLSCSKPLTDMQYDQYPVYEGEDLGLTYSPEKSIFKVWAPTASQLFLKIYSNAEVETPESTYQMTKGNNGEWEIHLDGDLKGKFYTFQATINNQTLQEVPDPYAYAVGINGWRGAVVDLSETNPSGWQEHQKPDLKHFADIIIQEIHIRDLSVHPESGIQNKGKYLGFTEKGTTGPKGVKTGLDHILDLGVTHVHLLPTADFGSIDERYPEKNQFNWGYDPQNYNVPEGSYATNAHDPQTRIREFKQLIQTMHENGLRVILDVVYNHTYRVSNSVFTQLVPGYYYRHNEDGSYSNASLCGNETASERPMVRKMIVESIKFWAREYKVDGFRFDLMGIHDLETMKAIREALDEIDPSIYMYGEGWLASESPLPEKDQAVKKHTYKVKGLAAFSDELRDAVKGHWSDHEEKGMVGGKEGLEESIKFGIVGAVQHPQIDYSKVNYAQAPWALEPTQCVNYVSCHDDLTLFDKLKISNPEASEEEIIKMQKLSAAILLTSQGVPFLHAGADFLRTKGGNDDSYKSPDSVNQLDWARKAQYLQVHEYFKGLITLRKNHSAFRLPTQEMIAKHLRFLSMPSPNMVGYMLKENANEDSWENILVIFNGNKNTIPLTLPKGNWVMVADGNQVGNTPIKEIKEKNINIPATSALILVNKESFH
jgi:pullulanase